MTEIRGFLGLVGCYCHFIWKFAEISALFSEMKESFEGLKLKSIFQPVFGFLDFEKPFVMEITASLVAVGAVIAQRN